MRFSIIVPVFNCLKSLQYCVDSILTQSFDDFELILVDDGSTDGTSNLCDLLQKADQRVRVIHRTNGGTSAARNTGIASANGEYLAFLDNDDVWLHDNVLLKLDACIQARHSDIICFRTVDCWLDDNSEIAKQPPAPLLNASFFDDVSALIKVSFYTPAVWSKVVKADLIQSHSITFPDGMRNEDVDFSCKLLQVAESIDFIDDVFYLWIRGRSESQSSKAVNSKIANDLASIIKTNADNARALEDERKRIIEEFLSFPYAVWMTYTYAFSHDELANQWAIMKDYSYLLNRDGDQRAQMVRNVSRLFGASTTRRIAALAASIKSKRQQ